MHSAIMYHSCSYPSFLQLLSPPQACLTLPQSAGIIGGKPRHALYFIGYHGDNMLYLDPHTTQPAVSSSDTGVVLDQSYHCTQPDRMSISDLDPSVALVTVDWGFQ